MRLSDKKYWSKQFRTEQMGRKNVHFCKTCEFSSTVQKEIGLHVRKHMKNAFPFACDRSVCDKAFKTRQALEEHLSHHKCGYGMPGMETGLCGTAQLKQYYEMTVKGNRFTYVCKWKDCPYMTTHVTAIQKHIHDTHVCPNRKDSPRAHTDG